MSCGPSGCRAWRACGSYPHRTPGWVAAGPLWALVPLHLSSEAGRGAAGQAAIPGSLGSPVVGDTCLSLVLSVCRGLLGQLCRLALSLVGECGDPALCTGLPQSGRMAAREWPAWPAGLRLGIRLQEVGRSRRSRAIRCHSEHCVPWAEGGLVLLAPALLSPVLPPTGLRAGTSVGPEPALGMLVGLSCWCRGRRSAGPGAGCRRNGTAGAPAIREGWPEQGCRWPARGN